MKTTSKLILLFILLISYTLIYSQNEIMNYKPPQVIKGSNLVLSSKPRLHFSETKYDKYNQIISDIHIFADIKFSKWRFTENLNYSFYIEPKINYSRYQTESDGNFNVEYSSIMAGYTLSGAVNKYILENVYTGLYINNLATIGNKQKPGGSLKMVPFIGIGKLHNTSQIISADNFESVLRNEKFIDKRLAANVRKKIIELLDKWNNREFYSKYKDDEDIIFFSELESLLLENKIISTPLNSRTTLKLQQTLRNAKFLHLPLFKGYYVQLLSEINMANPKNNHDKVTVNKDITINTLYAKTFSINTSLLGNVYFSLPLDNNHELIRGYFTSPITLIESNQYFNYAGDIFAPNPIEYNKYSFISGIGLVLYHYLSNTAGIRTGINYDYGKIKDVSNDFYYFRTYFNFKYNLLSALNLDTKITYINSSRYKHHISTDIGFEYFIF